MAERPIIIPSPDEPDFVRTLSFSFVWNPGLAVWLYVNAPDRHGRAVTPKFALGWYHAATDAR